MKLSRITVLAGCLGMSVSVGALADQSQDVTVSQEVSQVDKRTQLLEQEVTELQAKVNSLSAAVETNEGKPSSARYLEHGKVLDDEEIAEAVRAHSLISFGPYLNIRTQFDGSELIVRTPSIRESSRLLLGNYQNEQAALKAGKPLPGEPRIELSGVFGGQMFYSRGYDAGISSDIDFTDAEVDTYVVVNPWISAFMATAYSNAAGDTARPVDNSNVAITKAFITLGNFDKTSFYSSLGQMYVPFGRYSSAMVTAPLTQNVARTKERTLLVGYQGVEKNAFYTEAYAFQASSGFASESSTINDGGVDIGYDYAINDRVNGEIGAGVISTIADSTGIQSGSSMSGGFEGLSCSTCSEGMKHRVPGADVYAQFSYKPVSLVAEYVTATHAFDQETGFLYGDRGAKPAAQNVELEYSLQLFSKPSSVALGYGHTSESVMLGLPNHRLIAAYNVSIWQHTLETLEYRRDYNYSTGSSDVVTSDSAQNLGKIDNVVTAQIYVYF